MDNYFSLSYKILCCEPFLIYGQLAFGKYYMILSESLIRNNYLHVSFA